MSQFIQIFLSSLFFILILLVVFKPRFAVSLFMKNGTLEQHTDLVDTLPDSQAGLWIMLAAGLGLYTELMIIRIHSSYFQLFAYFKNVSLLSCFLGLGIGYARGERRPLTTPIAFPFLALQMVFMYILRFSGMAKLLHNPISEQFTLGMGQAQQLTHILIVYCFLLLIFVFNALCFVPLGQLVSRLMMRRKKLAAYGWNLIGSLAGIIVFSLISFAWAPPSVWIVLAAFALFPFLFKSMRTLLPSVIAVVILLVILALPIGMDQYDVYSPYQILTVAFSKDLPPVLKTSNIYYLKILDLSEKSVRDDETLQRWSDYYSLPYRFMPNAEDVLIVGSGAGNDAAAAIRNGAGRIDAVEIDPAIVEFGRELHPESPYQASNVNVIVNDARAFIRATQKQYDVIVYGLLDSHTLLSGMSGGIRLDSYVYTVEAFREARHKLKENGILCLTFYVMSREMGRKLFLMLQQAFDGQSPVVYQAEYDGGYTFLAGNGLKKSKLLSDLPFTEVTPHFAHSGIMADTSTDDWPFFYMPLKQYPLSYVVMIFLLIGISIALIWRSVAGAGSGFSAPCFFLGAGFMLIETKGITELALVYGSTWIVISAVIAAILIMAFLANLLVMRIGSLHSALTYGLLFASLIAGFSITFFSTEGMNLWVSRAVLTSVLTFPLFFSGFAFSTELSRATTVAVALSSNLLGAMVGGFLEYNSMYFGFRSLYLFALGMYILAFLFSSRRAS